MALVLVASMLAMFAMPVRSWEYFNTTIAAPQTDNIVDYSGPHADRIQVRMFDDEQSVFNALEAGEIDIMDCPVDANHYIGWTQPPLNADIAVVNTGPELGMYILDMRMDNREEIAPGVPNPAYTAPWGNPMADIWLRRAIAACTDKKRQVEGIVSGGSPPWLGCALYTPLSVAYGDLVHPDITPTGSLKELTYLNPDGSADCDLAWNFLVTHGYSYNASTGHTEYLGQPFTLGFYYRNDHRYRNDFATIIMYPCLAAAPPAGLGLNVNMIGVDSGGARASVMDAKMGHMYTGGWGLTPYPEHLYYLFHISNYWHPGRPPNYMHYPGDDETIEVPFNGWQYTKEHVPELYAPVVWGIPPYFLDLSDYVKTYNKGDEVWRNPQNYWAWEMMIAGDSMRFKEAVYKSQEAIAYLVVGNPVWASVSYTAFHRTYVGGTPEEITWQGQPWKGSISTCANRMSAFYAYNMHPANSQFGDGTHMTVRFGIGGPITSLNPLYAESDRDWLVLNQAYERMLIFDPYTLDEIPWLAHNWEIGTWLSPDYGNCTKVTFNMRHNLYWSDGMPVTASDVKFTWGGPALTGSLSNLLLKKGYPPAHWASQVADILSIATPDPWTVIVYLDVYAYFGLYSMSGFNIVLPEHIWKPIIETGDPTQPWNQPNVCTGPYIIESTADPGPVGIVWLHKNPLHFQLSQTEFPKDNPVSVWTLQTSNATIRIGNTHWIYPLKGEVGVDASVTVYLHVRYPHEFGPFKEQVCHVTRMDGLKNVTLWTWNGVGCPNQEENYMWYKDIALNVPWVAERCIPEAETFGLGFVPAWWYIIKVDIVIQSLEYFDGINWVPVDPLDNPYMNMVISYKEKMVVTNRYDVCGLFWKPCPPAAGKYQIISDLKANVKDLYADARAFGSRPGYPNWNTACDVNDDFKVDVKDYYAISQNFGWVATYPGP